MLPAARAIDVIPANSPAAAAMAAPNSSARQSSAIGRSARNAMTCGTDVERIARVPIESAAAAAAAAIDLMSTSATICLASRHRDAPSDDRSVISASRRTASASSTLAALPMAISNSSATAPARTRSAVAVCGDTAANGIKRKRRPAPMPDALVASTSCCACDSDSPRRTCATTSDEPIRELGRGSHAAVRRDGNAKPGGMVPTIV